jgi:L-rhamnose-H+ transport protein
MRYLGVALGQSIALGLCAAFGTIIPAVIGGQNLFSSRAGILTVIGVAITVAGISIIGYAGSLKSKEMTEEEKRASVKEFALKKGILIAIFAGIMSACFNFGFEAGKPIEDVALAHGTNPLFQKNPTLIFILFGGFLTNLVYCGYLNIKNKTYRDYLTSSGNVLLNNLAFTFLAGFLWFLQFHFFGMGVSKLPEGMAVFGWSILMALNIAISNIWGIVLNEWKGVKSKTVIVLIIGIIVLILSTFVVKLS